MNAEQVEPNGRSRHILVGVDGTASSLAAVRWAADEAVRRDLPLVLLHVTPYEHPTSAVGLHGPESILARGRTVARRHAAGVDVSTRLVTGAIAAALVEASTDATLLAMGLTGGGRANEVLLSSATLAVSGHAACPVVGVRTWPLPTSTRREIVLGVDVDTEAGVLDAAFEMAEQRDSDLVVVHCASGKDPETGDAESGWLWDEVAAARDRHPGVKAHSQVHRGLALNTVTTMLQQSARAMAIVVGTRNQSLAARFVLGSTSRGLLRHSQVPVVVVGPGNSPAAADAHGRSRAAAPTSSTR